MFDKLIVSEPAGADFKDRRNYFMVSSVVVGLLFITAVVVSIFAADFGLGNGGFELVEMIAPLDLAAAAPEPPRPRMQTTQNRSTTLPTRQVDLQDVRESPRVPDAISTTPNTAMSRPLDQRFQNGPVDTNPAGGTDGARNAPGTSGPGNGLAIDQPAAAEPEREVAPPSRPEPVKKPPVQSLGVINGKATSLPKPMYSAAARAIRAAGKVDVQVSIDEEGRVTSATAVNGHPLLRSAAEQAARNAKFSVTYLSKVPVKVTGVIVYNFIL